MLWVLSQKVMKSFFRILTYATLGARLGVEVGGGEKKPLLSISGEKNATCNILYDSLCRKRLVKSNNSVTMLPPACCYCF
ncbi:hypothetical protein CEXT_552131 [Caerostris extrusa]|uniref:Secreted protein n=1 Tax=Caerostris extrusa TaxID=172846 RepID=A0AAV4X8A0_CAEEX|nr:hypothetical protein CEXT_552131 [Caerostris extrusa]